MTLTTDEKLLSLSHEIVEAFDKVDGGIHPGFRPAHAKGMLLTGGFTPSPEAGSLTRAPHLHRDSTPVTVRFSNFAGIPSIADNDPQGPGPRGLAVLFHLAAHGTPTSSPLHPTPPPPPPPPPLSPSSPHVSP